MSLHTGTYKQEIKTTSKARLRLIHEDTTSSYHWLFLPGGPGLGSESLADLVDLLQVPGSYWLVDLPGDGSNYLDINGEDFSRWQEALIEISDVFQHSILVAHSSGGMYALSTPVLEDKLTGMVLIGSAPDSSWQDVFANYVKEHPIPQVDRLQKQYQEHPSDDALKSLTIASIPYFSMTKNISSMKELLLTLPFNCKSHLWAERHFDANHYKALWVPEVLPMMILTGDQDSITPLRLFSDSPLFQRENILIQMIENASHFPWMDNPLRVQRAFADYFIRLDVG